MSDISMGTVYVTAEQLAGVYWNARRRGMRGANIYTLSDLLTVSGETKRGQIVSGQLQQNLFTLSIEERVQIYRKCGPVFGVITGRANRIAGLEWRITRVAKHDDRVEAQVKMAADLFKEWKDDASLQGAVVRARCYAYVRKYIPEVRADLSNIASALLRWKRRNKIRYEDKSTQIEDWLHRPNSEDNLSQFMRKSVVDLHTHGAAAWYKERDPGTGLLENIYVLPGGTVLPFRQMYVGGGVAYAQILNGIPPKIYFTDEISYLPYAPNSYLSYGAVPLEALVNKIAETLLFDEQAAMKADGTSAPEKMIVMNETLPFGDEEASKDLTVPLNLSEQSRIETLVNEPRRNAIRLLTGYGGSSSPVVIDLSRADTFAAQSDRQDKILRDIAIVFQCSNIEVNLTGSEETSGRETSQTQAQTDQAKGWKPTAQDIEDRINTDLLPERWGPDYRLEIDKGISEREQVELERLKLQTGTYDVNALRMERGDDPYPDEVYDRPPGQGGAQPSPDGSEASPLAVRNVG
jgi:hypothetical protein